MPSSHRGQAQQNEGKQGALNATHVHVGVHKPAVAFRVRRPPPATSRLQTCSAKSAVWCRHAIGGATSLWCVTHAKLQQTDAS